MKKIISLVLLSIFFFNSSYAEKYWSNKKDGPTTVKEAKTYILSKLLKITPNDAPLIDPPLHGIWYSSNLGFVAIYPLSNDSDTSYEVKLISAPRWIKDENIKSTKYHEGTTEGTIVQNGENNYLGYNKMWWIQNDGSYKYTTNKGKIVLKSENQFIYKRESHRDPNGKTHPKFDESFYKISFNKSYNIIQFLEKNDKSRDVSDYDILHFDDGGLQIRLNKEKAREDKSDKNKYIQINVDGSVYIGIYTWDKIDKSILIWDSIYCKDNILYIQNTKYFPDKKLKSYCDPLKITYSTFLYYKYRYYLYGFGTILIILIWLYLAKKYRKKELANYNKKNKKKFETYLEYKEHLQILLDIEWEKDQKQQEKEKKAQEIIRKAQEAKRLKEEQKLEAEEKRREKLEREPVSVSVKDDNDDSLMSKIKRLKALYKNGTLTKAEFEKAKNKLLK